MKTNLLTLSLLLIALVFGVAACNSEKSSESTEKTTAEAQPPKADSVKTELPADTSASAAASTSVSNMITFEKKEHDFGKIVTGSPVTYSFKFKNTHNKPVKIEKVKPSCGCTTPDYTKDVIPVGGEGFVKVEYNNKSEGPVAKSVTVTAVSVPAGDEYNTQLKFKAEAVKK